SRAPTAPFPGTGSRREPRSASLSGSSCASSWRSGVTDLPRRLRTKYTLAYRGWASDSGSLTTEIRRIRPGEGLKLRALRLRALADTPMAFGSTLAREQAFPESVWHERAAGAAAGLGRATFIAAEADQWIGLATGLAEDPDGLRHEPILVG